MPKKERKIQNYPLIHKKNQMVHLLDMAGFGPKPKTQILSTQNSFGQNFWTQNPKTQFGKKTAISYVNI